MDWASTKPQPWSSRPLVESLGEWSGPKQRTAPLTDRGRSSTWSQRVRGRRRTAERLQVLLRMEHNTSRRVETQTGAMMANDRADL